MVGPGPRAQAGPGQKPGPGPSRARAQAGPGRRGGVMGPFGGFWFFAFLWGLAGRACIIALSAAKCRLHFKRGR